MKKKEYKKKLEFGREEYDQINGFCKELQIAWTASVWDIDSVNFMLWYKNDIPFIKIPIKSIVIPIVTMGVFVLICTLCNYNIALLLI